MKSRPQSLTSPSFALISVLALVSLAALTATAFLASARLDRQASRPLGETAQLEMACTSARECASQTLNLVCEPKWNTITTYWRGTNATDWTNELGYPLIAKPVVTNNLKWIYFCGFNTALHKKIDTILFSVEMTNTNPWLFLSEIGNQMQRMTNNFVTNPAYTNTNCTLIPLLGGRTSPPVGWTYIYQDKRIPNSANTINVPVARFSYYMEDLSGLIDAERMGGSINRSTGTNCSEISLTNLTTNWSSNSIINAGNQSQFTNPINRIKYFSPALMTYAGGITTNDLRYFAHGLLSWSNFPETIPVGVPISGGTSYSQGGNLKTNINGATISNLVAAITNNNRDFTNRAGGMDGTVYMNALAANIVDYADTDSTPSTTNTTNGYTVIGYDSYPLLTHLYDQFTYNGLDKTIVHTTWLQFWNPSTQPTTAVSITVSCTNNDIVRYTNSAGTVVTNNLYNNLTATNTAANTATNTAIFSLPIISTNAGFITNFTRTIDLSSFPLFPLVAPPTVWLNCRANNTLQSLTTANLITNSFSYSIDGVSIIPAMPLRKYQFDTLTSGTPIFSAGFLAGNQYISATAGATSPGIPLPIHDPRMTPYLGLTNAPPSTRVYAESINSTTFWGGYVSQSGLSMDMGLADPAFWPDATSTTVASHGTPSSPNQGAFQNPEAAPCKISNAGSYTNICELGNVFDPMQWAPPTTTTVNYSNCNIDNSWSKNNLYGGGSTLRIGRPEHSRFAFTIFGASTNLPYPYMARSSASLLDIFAITNQRDNGGRINLNTAPAPVLRALAGGITLSSDYNMKPTNTLLVPKTMTEAFAQGVMRFRSTYPFLSCSQLPFIATDYGITNTVITHWTNTWPTNAVFGNSKSGIILTNAPGNTLGVAASNGVTAWNDQAAEEWFSKIYNLSTVQSFHFRTYVVAQLVNTNGLPTGPAMRKYYYMYIRYNAPYANGINAGPFVSFESPY